MLKTRLIQSCSMPQKVQLQVYQNNVQYVTMYCIKTIMNNVLLPVALFLCLCVCIQIEVFVKESLTEDTTHLRNNALHSEMTAVLDLGTNLLSHSTQHIRRLTDMETQV